MKMKADGHDKTQERNALVTKPATSPGQTQEKNAPSAAVAAATSLKPPLSTSPASPKQPKQSSLKSANAVAIIKIAQRSILNIDSIIDRLMNIGKPNAGISVTINEQDIMDLLCATKNLFLEQPMFLELNAPMVLVGDIHGQFTDLIRIFGKTGFPNKTSYLFLGDYIDRGSMNMETILTLFAFKIKFANNFFLLRGNHETQFVNRVYGFYEEINRRYQSPMLYDAFQDVFNVMPLSACVADRILCMHGGLSPELFKSPTLKILNLIQRPLSNPPNPSLPLDLLWADPDFEVDGFIKSNRGVSCLFGPNLVHAMCKKHNLDLICRAHQVVQDGYEFFAARKLVTLFSAPHYCGEFDNAAAVMVVKKNLECSFRIFRPKWPKTTTIMKSD